MQFLQVEVRLEVVPHTSQVTALYMQQGQFRGHRRQVSDEYATFRDELRLRERQKLLVVSLESVWPEVRVSVQHHPHRRYHVLGVSRVRADHRAQLPLRYPLLHYVYLKPLHCDLIVVHILVGLYPDVVQRPHIREDETSQLRLNLRHHQRTFRPLSTLSIAQICCVVSCVVSCVVCCVVCCVTFCSLGTRCPHMHIVHIVHIVPDPQYVLPTPVRVFHMYFGYMR